MHPCLKNLWEKIEQNPPVYGYLDAQSLLDMLYVCYTEWNPIDSEKLHQYFSGLDQYWIGCTKYQRDDAFELVCLLCGEQERLAFQEGIRVGIQLAQEL